MRVCVDANLLIRYLLTSPNPNRAVDVIIDAGLDGTYTLLTMEQLRREVVEAIGAKAWLRSRITISAADKLFDMPERRGELLPTLLGPPATICRDPRDDYLLAHAETGRADVLVTDDNDLLVLDGEFSFHTLTPADFFTVLREHGLI